MSITLNQGILSTKILRDNPTLINFNAKFQTVSVCEDADYLFTFADKEVQEMAAKTGMVALKAITKAQLATSFEDLVKEGKLIRLSTRALPTIFKGTDAHCLTYTNAPEGISDWISYLKIYQIKKPQAPLLIQAAIPSANGTANCFVVNDIVYQRQCIREDLLKDNMTDALRTAMHAKERISRVKPLLEGMEDYYQHIRISIAATRAAGKLTTDSKDRKDGKDQKDVDVKEGKADIKDQKDSKSPAPKPLLTIPRPTMAVAAGAK